MTPQFKKNEYGSALFFLAWLWHNAMNNSTFSTSLPLFKGVLTLQTTSTHNQTLTWDCPLQAQVLSNIWCVPAMREVAQWHVHTNVCCYGLVLNTGEPMNTLYILIPLFLLNWQSLFRTLEVLSSGIPYTDWLCLDHWSCNWWFLTKPLEVYKFKIFTLTYKCVSVHWYISIQNRWLSSAFVLAMVNNVDACAYFLLIFLLHKTYYFKLHNQVLSLLFHNQNWRWTLIQHTYYQMNISIPTSNQVT